MIKLSQPRAYDGLKPLHDSTGRPLRFQRPTVLISKVPDRPNCHDCPDRLCLADKCER